MIKNPTMNEFAIQNLAVSVAKRDVIKKLSLTIRPGELHVLMGPNGSGKSTLAAALVGHPDYEVVSGSITLNGESMMDHSPDERARHGLFLAFQYPVEIPGLSVQNFLRYAHEARFADAPEKRFSKILPFREYAKSLAKELHIKPELLERGLHEGFSGGEKKRLEMLQMALLEPHYAILDEVDSGLDIDAVRQVAKSIEFVRKRFNTGFLVITHYQRILKYLSVGQVHVMVNGNIVVKGGAELVESLEKSGYAEWTKGKS